jgi:hypothetical protein
LWEKDTALTCVVSKAVPMPSKLRQVLLEFAIRGALAARKNAASVKKPDMHKTYLLSHCVLFIWHLEIALFAINHMYPVMSKQSMEILESQTAKGQKLALHSDYQSTAIPVPDGLIGSQAVLIK